MINSYNYGMGQLPDDDEQNAQKMDQPDQAQGPQVYQKPVDTSQPSATGSFTPPSQPSDTNAQQNIPQTFAQMQAAGIARPPAPPVNDAPPQGMDPMLAPSPYMPQVAPPPLQNTMPSPFTPAPQVPDSQLVWNDATGEYNTAGGQRYLGVNTDPTMAGNMSADQITTYNANNAAQDALNARNGAYAAGGTWDGTDAGRVSVNGVSQGMAWDPTTGSFTPGSQGTAANPGMGVSLGGKPVTPGTVLPQNAVDHTGLTPGGTFSDGSVVGGPVNLGGPASRTDGTGPTAGLIPGAPNTNPAPGGTGTLPPQVYQPPAGPSTSPTPTGTGQAPAPGFDILNSLVNGAQGQGAGSAVQSQTEQNTLNLLKNPNAYGTQDVKDLYNWESGNIDDQYKLQQQQLGDEMAHRGLGNSTINAGRLNDLNIGRRSAQETMGQDLAHQYATSANQANQAAIGIGNTVGSTEQGNNINWLQNLIGYGQQGFNNDMATNQANQSANDSYRNFILQLLGYTQGAGA